MMGNNTSSPQRNIDLASKDNRSCQQQAEHYNDYFEIFLEIYILVDKLSTEVQPLLQAACNNLWMYDPDSFTLEVQWSDKEELDRLVSKLGGSPAKRLADHITQYFKHQSVSDHATLLHQILETNGKYLVSLFLLKPLVKIFLSTRKAIAVMRDHPEIWTGLQLPLITTEPTLIMTPATAILPSRVLQVEPLVMENRKLGPKMRGVERKQASWHIPLMFTEPKATGDVTNHRGVTPRSIHQSVHKLVAIVNALDGHTDDIKTVMSYDLQPQPNHGIKDIYEIDSVGLDDSEYKNAMLAAFDKLTEERKSNTDLEKDCDNLIRLYAWYHIRGLRRPYLSSPPARETVKTPDWLLPFLGA